MIYFDMTAENNFVSPERVLAAIYGKTSLETGLSEKRRDEIIAAAIFTSFRNQEFGTRFKLPADFRNADWKQDAEGIDLVVTDKGGRKKKLQIKGIHIERSVRRRKTHATRGLARITGVKYQKFIMRDSEELTKIMKGELDKIDQDYSGMCLIIYVSADLATQTSLEIAIRKAQKTVAKLKAREIWMIRNIPIRMVNGKHTVPNCHTYELLKISPDRHSYCYSFAI